MPKTVHGTYIKTEKSIKKIIELMDRRKKDEKIILKDIDDYSCIINSDMSRKVLDEIEKYQSKYLFEDQNTEKK